MPIITCRNCGHKTNTTVADYVIQVNKEMKIIKEAKRLLTTGRISSEGIKLGLYDPKKQTLK